MKASIVIANYNSEKFISDCIDSINSQSYKNFEIIFFDDNSNDNSISTIQKYKSSNIKIIENKIQTNFGCLNQINAFNKAIEVSRGEIIFFLDSDDYFHEKKLEKIIKLFTDEKSKNIIFDYPIILKNDQKIKIKNKKKFFKTYWEYIHPTSCISIRKSFVEEIINSISSNEFTNIWMDFRIHLYSKYIKKKDYLITDENLTYYRQTEDNISSKFKKFSINWWKRRNEAHDYFFSIAKKNSIKINKNFDFLITKLIYSIIK